MSARIAMDPGGNYMISGWQNRFRLDELNKGYAGDTRPAVS
jgi:hypothetical protein